MDRTVEEILGKAAAAVDSCRACRRFLKAVVLGGGYGRGEGGVYRSPADGSMRLYNDLDLFVFTVPFMSRAKKKECRSRLKEIEGRLSAEYGVEVEFGPLTSVRKLKNLAPTLMYQELIRGWVPVWGDASVVRVLPELPWERLPLSEGMRLLLNRGAGLLLAGMRLEQESLSAGDADFVLRNIHKAALAVGDAFLLARRRYVFGVRERAAALAREDAFPEKALEQYGAAVRFKFSPGENGAADLKAAWLSERDSWLEAYEDFCRVYHPAVPHSPGQLVKNVLLNLRYRPEKSLKGFFLHPREKLIHRLPFLLFDKSQKDQYITVHSDNKFNHANQGDIVMRNRFLDLWRRFN